MTHLRTGPLALAFAFATAACSDISEAPTAPVDHQADITFGEPDGNDHPYVGTLLFVQNGVGYYSCTGTLLSSTVMLTAGHCVEEDGNENDVTYVRFTEDALADIGSYPSLQAWLDAEWILASDVVPHPQYDDFSQFPATYDVGLVILSEPYELDTYGVLPELGLLDRLSKGSGRDKMFTAVGYGLQGVINPFYGDDYERRQATTRLIDVRSTRTGPSHSAKFTNNPGKGSGTGGTCYGDSGGPILYGDTNIIAAITSFGYTPCIGNDFSFRIDIATSLDFITPYLN